MTDTKTRDELADADMNDPRCPKYWGYTFRKQVKRSLSHPYAESVRPRFSRNIRQCVRDDEILDIKIMTATPYCQPRTMRSLLMIAMHEAFISSKPAIVKELMDNGVPIDLPLQKIVLKAPADMLHMFFKVGGSTLDIKESLKMLAECETNKATEIAIVAAHASRKVVNGAFIAAARKWNALHVRALIVCGADAFNDAYNALKENSYTNVQDRASIIKMLKSPKK